MAEIVGYPKVLKRAARDYADFQPETASMRTLTDQLAQYAAYHRDRRNIATHFVGIPMIVLALAVLLSRPAWSIAGLPFALSPAFALFGLSALYYLVLDVSLGLMMIVISALRVACGNWLAAQSTIIWLATGIGLFVIGWIVQFVGHAVFEHRKPAFVDDLAGLIIGPLFLLVEALFGAGWRPELRESVERQVEATRS
jgi:uncharacterized membrane protein YGL010W